MHGEAKNTVVNGEGGSESAVGHAISRLASELEHGRKSNSNDRSQVRVNQQQFWLKQTTPGDPTEEKDAMIHAATFGGAKANG